MFRTHNTPLVAWLILCGSKINSIEIEGNSATFILESIDTESMAMWQCGQAAGNINEYYLTYRSLLERVKKEVRGANGQG